MKTMTTLLIVIILFYVTWYVETNFEQQDTGDTGSLDAMEPSISQEDYLLDDEGFAEKFIMNDSFEKDSEEIEFGNSGSYDDHRVHSFSCDHNGNSGNHKIPLSLEDEHRNEEPIEEGIDTSSDFKKNLSLK